MSEGVILPWNKSNSFYTELINEVCDIYSINPIKNGEIYLKNKGINSLR